MTLEARFNIKEGERLESVARASVVTLLPVILIEAILIATPFFFLRPLLRWQTLGYILIGILLFFGLFFALRTFAKWRGSFLAVTGRRLIVVRRDGIFAREVVELPFDKVQEISFRVRGLGPSLFGYGSLLIQSAGSDEPIVMSRVRRPQDLHRLIIELQEQRSGGPGDFGHILQSVSRLDDRKLQLLKAEVERTLKERV